MIKNYNDKFNLAQMAEDGDIGEKNNAFPTKDNNENPLTAEYGFCVYKDTQTVTI
jgi:hypothetical protein